jgi:hypothetical protein
LNEPVVKGLNVTVRVQVLRTGLIGFLLLRFALRAEKEEPHLIADLRVEQRSFRISQHAIRTVGLWYQFVDRDEAEPTKYRDRHPIDRRGALAQVQAISGCA